MLNFFNKISPTSFFVGAALVCEILFFWATPALQAPDEFNHFYRAYQVSEGYILPQQIDKRLGGQIPYDISDFVAPFKMASWVREYRPPRNGHSDSFKQEVSKASVFRDFPNTAYYSPVSYLPQAFVISILRLFNAPASVIYYGGRIFGFIISLLVLLYAIRIIPVYKWLFTVLLLLPMNLFILNSFSADNVTNILAILFIALVFKMTFTENKIAHKTIYALAAIAVLLALAKLVYIGLILLVLIIPAHKFKSRSQQLICVLGVFIISFSVTSLWSSVVTDHYLNYESYNSNYRDAATIVPKASYHEQKAYILDHPAYFPRVVVKSIFNPKQTYLAGYVGNFGAFLDVPMPLWIIILAYVVILFVALAEKNDFSFSIVQKLIMLCAVFTCLVLLLLSQHLTWDAVGKGRVDLIQGRYLVPLFPLLFILPGNLVRVRMNVSYGVIPLILLLNTLSVWLLYERYIYEPYNAITTFTCDVEEMDEWGNFKTSSPSAILQGCRNQSDFEKRNGNFSALVSPKCPYSFTYRFKGLKQGEMVDISLWKKGDAALAMTGSGKNCEPYYNEFNDAHYTDRKGWTNMHGILVVPQACDTIDIGFFIGSKKDTIAYIDDLTFTIKRKK